MLEPGKEEEVTTQVSQIQCSEISSSTEKDQIIISDMYSDKGTSSCLLCSEVADTENYQYLLEGDYDSNGEPFSCTNSDSGGKIWIESWGRRSTLGIRCDLSISLVPFRMRQKIDL